MTARVTASISVISKRFVPCKLSQAGELVYRSRLHPGGSVYSVVTFARSDVSSLLNLGEQTELTLCLKVHQGQTVSKKTSQV